ncbi:hypothetical protein QTP88_006592 [Uroleucon formosanum]
MTVITMPTTEKKSDNVPLVTNIEIDPSAQEKDPESGNAAHNRPVRSKFLVLRVINDRVYSMWALIYVLLMSLVITFMMLYGEHIYRAIGNAFNDENFALNMENLNNRMVNPEDVISQFKEDFELDLRDESYEKILPILPLANSARFIHDFSANVTGIVDIDGKRCFIMPLNRSAVLPPQSLYDLLFKMSSGYYTIDTSNVMHDMRVVKPAIQDLTEYGIYIAKDCAGFPTYKLEKIVSGVFKRSVSTQSKTFSAFSGQMDSYRLVNYQDIDLQ